MDIIPGLDTASTFLLPLAVNALFVSDLGNSFGEDGDLGWRDDDPLIAWLAVLTESFAEVGDRGISDWCNCNCELFVNVDSIECGYAKYGPGPAGEVGTIKFGGLTMAN